MSFMPNFYLFIYHLGPEMAMRVITQAQSVPMNLDSVTEAM